MSDLKKIIDYLQIEKPKAPSLNVGITIVDKNYNYQHISHEEDLKIIEKKDLEGGFYKNLGEQITTEEIYLKYEGSEILYYVKKEFDVNNLPTNLYKRIPLALTDVWETLDEITLIKKEIPSTTGYYYSYELNKVIFANFLDDIILTDVDIIDYLPKNLIENGEYYLLKEDLKNDIDNFFGNKQLITPNYDKISFQKKKIEFKKATKSGLIHLVPSITKQYNKYIVSYHYYQKGIPINWGTIDEAAINIEFDHPVALLEYLNHTIFFCFDDVSAFYKNKNRDLFLEIYISLIKHLLNNSNSFIDKLIVLSFVPAYIHNTQGKYYLIELLDQAIRSGIITNDGRIAVEDYVVHLLEGIYYSFEDKSLFLNQMLQVINNKTRLEQLHFHVDGENNVKIINLLYSAWKQSRFINPSDEANPEYKNTNGPIFLPYESEKWAGFYFSNANVSFEKQGITVALETGRYEEKDVSNPKFAGGKGKVKKEIIENYTYHPFHPIYIKNVEQQETTIAFESIIPAFLLYANENKAFWHNFVKTGEYIIDGITIASGFASLRAAKYFAHVARLAEAAEGVTAVSKVAKAANILRYVKGAAGVVEVTSGSVNLMLKLTELDETEFGQSLSKVLFYLELITLAGELTVPMKAGLKKSAKEVIENADSAVRAKNAKLFFELYKITNLVSKGGKVKYGESILSTFAIAYRKNLGKAGKHNGNIAVFAYVDKNGTTQFKEFTTFGSKKDWKAAGFKEKPHAEAIGNKWLETNNIPRENIFMVYSELNFCHFKGHNCNVMIHSNFPKAIKEYSYDYPGKLGDNLQNVRDKSINDRKFDLDKYIDNVEIDPNKYFNK